MDITGSVVPMQALDYLSAVFPGLTGLDDALIGQLTSVSRVLQVATNAVLFRQGAETDSLNWLLDGQVALFQAGQGGDDTVIDILRPVAGIAVGGVVFGQTYPVTARALAPTSVLTIGAAPFRGLMASRPALALEVMQSISRETVDAIWQIVDLKSRKAAQRLGCYLMSLMADPDASSAEFRLPIQKGMIAAKLGCRQENLSRAFATLQALGVETHGSWIRVSDVPRLRAFCASRKTGSAAAEAFSSAFDL